MSDRIEDMLDVLVHAMFDSIEYPYWEPYVTSVRHAVSAALRGPINHGGTQVVDGARLSDEECRSSALVLLAGVTEPADVPSEGVIALVATLLKEVRQADQREEWIRAGWQSSCDELSGRLADVEQEAALLRRAIRVIRSTARKVPVGRA